MKKNSFKVALVCLSLYFGYHLVNGQYGLISWARVRQDIEKNQNTLDHLLAKKKELTKMVNLISPAHLDLDLLEERAKTMLGYAYPDETVVILD